MAGAAAANAKVGRTLRSERSLMNKEFWKNTWFHLKKMFFVSLLFASIWYFAINREQAFMVFLISFGSYKLGAVAQMVWEDYHALAGKEKDVANAGNQ